MTEHFGCKNFLHPVSELNKTCLIKFEIMPGLRKQCFFSVRSINLTFQAKKLKRSAHITKSCKYITAAIFYAQITRRLRHCFSCFQYNTKKPAAQ